MYLMCALCGLCRVTSGLVYSTESQSGLKLVGEGGGPQHAKST